MLKMNLVRNCYRRNITYETYCLTCQENIEKERKEKEDKEEKTEKGEEKEKKDEKKKKKKDYQVLYVGETARLTRVFMKEETNIKMT